MRRNRLLNFSEDRGAAVVDTVFAVVFLMFLSLGVLQISLSLYARNSVIAATHEAARAAVELGRSAADAREVAAEHVRGSAGGLVRNITIDTAIVTVNEQTTVDVAVRADIKAFGPLPISVPVNAHARSEIDEVVFAHE